VGKAAVEAQQGLRRVAVANIAGCLQRLRSGVHRVGRRAARDRQPAPWYSMVAVRTDTGRAGGSPPVSARRALSETAERQAVGRWWSWPRGRWPARSEGSGPDGALGV